MDFQFEVAFNGTPAEFGAIADSFGQRVAREFFLQQIEYIQMQLAMAREDKSHRSAGDWEEELARLTGTDLPPASPYNLENGDIPSDANPVRVWIDEGDDLDEPHSTNFVAASKLPGGKSLLQVYGFGRVSSWWYRLYEELKRQGWVDASQSMPGAGNAPQANGDGQEKSLQSIDPATTIKHRVAQEKNHSDKLDKLRAILEQQKTKDDDVLTLRGLCGRLGVNSKTTAKKYLREIGYSSWDECRRELIRMQSGGQ